jgi:hypothetical protein
MLNDFGRIKDIIRTKEHTIYVFCANTVGNLIINDNGGMYNAATNETRYSIKNTETHFC